MPSPLRGVGDPGNKALGVGLIWGVPRVVTSAGELGVFPSPRRRAMRTRTAAPAVVVSSHERRRASRNATMSSSSCISASVMCSMAPAAGGVWFSTHEPRHPFKKKQIW